MESHCPLQWMPERGCLFSMSDWQWIAPRENWQEQDVFLVDVDYMRIKNNLLCIAQQAKKAGVTVTLGNMEDYTHQQVPTSDFFNGIEENVKKLAAGIWPRKEYLHRRFLAGSPVWDWQDLNRLEGMIRQMHQDVLGIWQGQPEMEFVLGGSEDAFIS